MIVRNFIGYLLLDFKNKLYFSIAQALKILEDGCKILGYSHFSLECDTLERVFLDLCSRAESGSPIITPIQDSVISMGNVGTCDDVKYRMIFFIDIC